MRVLVACSLVACATAAPKPAGPAAPVPLPAPRFVTSAEPHAPIDVIASLSADAQHTTWLVPGPIQLALGGSSQEATEGAALVEVDVLERQGNDVHVGVRLSTARFAVWTARARLLAVLSQDVRVDGDFGVGGAANEVVLRAGAQVRRLAHDGTRTKIRYVGAIEVEGWVSDDAVRELGDPGRVKGARIPTGRKALMVTPGTVIRTEARWIGKQLAVMNQSYFIDSVAEIGDGWHEVEYEDGDVRVHGYVSTRDPPGRTHRRPPPAARTTPYTPNATVPDHTCLFVDGEPIGFLVGDQQVILETGSRAGWFAITIDTPAWGPIPFDARGPTESSLDTCGT